MLFLFQRLNFFLYGWFLLFLNIVLFQSVQSSSYYHPNQLQKELNQQIIESYHQLIDFYGNIFEESPSSNLYSDRFSAQSDVVNGVISPAITTTTNPVGYVYSQFYYNSLCNGSIFAAVGISTQACLPYDTNSSYRLTFSHENCSDLTITEYSDTSCKKVVQSKNLYKNASQCYHVEDNQIDSFNILCSLGNSIPVNQDSVVFSCSKQIQTYVSFSTEICVPVEFYNHTIPIKSLTAQCASTSFTVYGYPESFTCDGTDFHQTFQETCAEVTHTEENLKYGNISIDARCYTFKTNTPTRAPSHKPSPSPTFQPTVNYVEFTASQIINGISITTYQSNISTYSLTLESSIAACMTGLTTENILDLVVVAGPADDDTENRRRLQYKSNFRLFSFSITAFPTIQGVSNSIFANYTVSTTESGVTYSSLSSELSTNVANGLFDQYLNQFSLVYDTPGFINATSTTVTTTNDLSSSGSSSNGQMSIGVIVGIVLGGMGGIAFIIVISYFTFNRPQMVIKSASISTDARKTELAITSTQQSVFTRDGTSDVNITSNPLFPDKTISTSKDFPSNSGAGSLQQSLPIEK